MMKALFVLISGILTSCAIEKPDYETVTKDGDFEVRKYDSIRVVSAPMDDMEKRDQSFRKLFKYISGENAEKKKIAMTSPVFMENSEDTAEKQKGRMSFMLPAEIAKAGAPSPDANEVSLGEIESGTFAVLRFKGWDNEKAQTAASEKLAELIAKNELKPSGGKFFAFYNPPWTPEWFRRNEVWQRVENAQ
jgi:DNA gyrase inhibitor GyrI